MSLIFIIIIIFMAQEMHYLKRENKELTEKIKRLIEKQKNEKTQENFAQSSTFIQTNISSQQYNNIQCSNVISGQISHEKNIKKQEITEKVIKKEKNKEETKNNFILMAGAFLIVLAAIVFLSSMWDVISDVLKVTVLLLLMGVFIGASKVADKTFKLKNTANTFFYIAMAYIPVLALAIYLIRLSSGYLQSSHDQNVFWLIACLIMSLIYGIISFKSKRKPLVVGSLLMQIFALISATSIFTDSFMTIILSVTVYNLILTIVDIYLKPKMFKNIIKTFNIVLFIILTIVIYISTLIGILFGVIFATLMALLVQTIIALMYARKTDKIAYIVMFVVGIFAVVLSSVNFENIYELVFIQKQIAMLITTLVLFVFGMFINWENLKKITKILTYVFLSLIYLSTWGTEGIYTSVVLFVTTMISILLIKIDSKYKNGYMHAAINLFILTGITFVFESSILVAFLLYLIPISLFVVSFFVDEKATKTIKIYVNIASIVSLFLYNIFVGSTLDIDYSRFSILATIMIAILELIYMFDFIKAKDKVSQLFFVIILNSLLYEIFNTLGIFEYSIYILFITSIVAFLMKNNRYINVYAIIAQLISMIILSFDITIVKFIINIFTTILICRNSKKLNWSEQFDLVPLSLIIPNIYFSNLELMQGYNIMQIVSILLISSITLLSIKDRAQNIYSYMAYVYLFMQVVCFDINKYINIVIFILISMLQMLNYNGKAKDVVKTILSLAILILYNAIIYDFNAQFISILLLGYVVVLAIITRRVIAKYNIDVCKTFEYIGYGILFVIALFNYFNIFDAMIFMALLIGMIIVTYNKKIGPIFLCSIMAEILIAFKVTEAFWTSIPWWVYLLVVGGGLIAFAIRNEAKEKKDGKTLKDTMKQISEKLDL